MKAVAVVVPVVAPATTEPVVPLALERDPLTSSPALIQKEIVVADELELAVPIIELVAAPAFPYAAAESVTTTKAYFPAGQVKTPVPFEIETGWKLKGTNAEDAI